jgi:hypothetical protein
VDVLVVALLLVSATDRGADGLDDDDLAASVAHIERFLRGVRRRRARRRGCAISD